MSVTCPRYLGHVPIERAKVRPYRDFDLTLHRERAVYGESRRRVFYTPLREVPGVIDLWRISPLPPSPGNCSGLRIKVRHNGLLWVICIGYTKHFGQIIYALRIKNHERLKMFIDGVLRYVPLPLKAGMCRRKPP